MSEEVSTSINGQLPYELSSAAAQRLFRALGAFA
jgi:hypothetical protein